MDNNRQLAKHRAKQRSAKERRDRSMGAGSFSIKARDRMDAIKRPACNGLHSYTWTNGKVNLSTRLFMCDVYKGKLQIEKGRLLEDVGGLRLCTSWIHSAARCYQDKRAGITPCSVKSGTSVCDKAHHKSLHLPKFA